VEDERRFVVEAAREWNSLRSKATGAFLNVLTWEDVVTPRLGERAQAVANEDFGDEYDVYLGIMWAKIGTPTGAAASGTVEEYERALERFRRDGSVHLAMLFKTNDIPQSLLVGSQFEQVQEFKHKFAEEGGFYGDFDSDDRLRRLLNRVFEDIAGAAGGPAPGSAPPSPRGTPPVRSREKSPTRGSSAPRNGGRQKTKRSKSSRNPTPDVDASETRDGGVEVARDQEGDISDIGLFEVNEAIEKVAGQQVQFFEDLSTVQRRANIQITEATEELETLVSFGQAEPARVKKVVARIAQSMNESAQFLEDRISLFRDRNDELAFLTERGFDLAQDFGEDHVAYIEFRSAVEDVVRVLQQNMTAIDGMIETTSNLPRLTTDFNRSRNRFISRNRELRTEIARLCFQMTQILNRYTRTDVAAVDPSASPP
jgi:hypothetical protein